MSWAAEFIADNSGVFYGNQIRLATKAEAESYARHKASAWTHVRDRRVVESTEPVNYRWTDENGLDHVDDLKGETA